MKRILIGCFVWLLALPLVAGNGPGAVRKQVEASMLLTGSIVVDEHGKVRQYEIDKSDKVMPAVREFVDSNVSHWVFDPIQVDGKVVSVRNKMNIRLIAKKMENGNFNVRVGGVTFYPFSSDTDGREVSSKNMAPPSYPMSAARAGLQGTVYLVLKIGHGGVVQEVVAEQTNLRTVASEQVMGRIRDIFEKSAKSAAMKWTFAPPTQGKDANSEFWSVRVPVDYYLDSEPEYGQWVAYVPGPRQSIPWESLRDYPAFSPDTMVAGVVQQLGGEGGLRLLTPLQSDG